MVVFTTHMHVRGMVAAFALACASGGVIAGGFQINETSASGLGNAFAGGAASAQDASTLWSNVAGLSRIESPRWLERST